MTGPSPVPHSAIPPNFDYWLTVLSQYANSPIITGLIGSANAALDETAFYDSLFANIWDVDTAQGYGLDVWGRIVGVTRNLTIAQTTPGPGGTFFGFAEAGTAWVGFGQGIFYSGGGTGGSGVSTVINITLLDPDFRTLILAKAGSNISDGSIPSTNNLLLNLFPGRGTVYVQDNQNMTMTYVFEFALTQVELAILTQSGVLPTPVGVAITIQQILPDSYPTMPVAQPGRFVSDNRFRRLRF